MRAQGMVLTKDGFDLRSVVHIILVALFHQKVTHPLQIPIPTFYQENFIRRTRLSATKVIANVLHGTTFLVTGNQLRVLFKILESHVWNLSKIQREYCEDPEIQDLFVETPQGLTLRLQKAQIFDRKVPKSLSSRKKTLRLFLICLSPVISGIRAHLELISTKVF